MGEEDGGGTIVHKYRILGKAGEGTFSEVLKAVHIHTKKYVAIKCMKQKFHSVQQVREISICPFVTNCVGEQSSRGASAAPSQPAQSHYRPEGDYIRPSCGVTQSRMRVMRHEHV